MIVSNRFWVPRKGTTLTPMLPSTIFPHEWKLELGKLGLGMRLPFYLSITPPTLFSIVTSLPNIDITFIKLCNTLTPFSYMNHLTTPSDLYDHMVLSVVLFALSGFIDEEGLLDQSVLTTDAVTAYGRRLHCICASLGDLPYLCFAWRLTISVLRLVTSPYLCASLKPLCTCQVSSQQYHWGFSSWN